VLDVDGGCGWLVRVTVMVRVAAMMVVGGWWWWRWLVAVAMVVGGGGTVPDLERHTNKHKSTF